MALSAALVWAWSSQETLLNDEWGYAFRAATEPAGQYLLQPPPGKHLIAIPLLLYKVAFDSFGIGSYAPYRIAHIVLLLLCAGLFYLLARRRIGDTLAVLPTAILLFLGSSWEVVAASFRSPSLVAIAAGLAMLLALERRDLKGDVAACLALALSLASHSTSFAFAAAAAVLGTESPGAGTVAAVLGLRAADHRLRDLVGARVRVPSIAVVALPDRGPPGLPREVAGRDAARNHGADHAQRLWRHRHPSPRRGGAGGDPDRRAGRALGRTASPPKANLPVRRCDRGRAPRLLDLDGARAGAGAGRQLLALLLPGGVAPAAAPVRAGSRLRVA